MTHSVVSSLVLTKPRHLRELLRMISKVQWSLLKIPMKIPLNPAEMSGFNFNWNCMQGPKALCMDIFAGITGLLYVTLCSITQMHVLIIPDTVCTGYKVSLFECVSLMVLDNRQAWTICNISKSEKFLLLLFPVATFKICATGLTWSACCYRWLSLDSDRSKLY